MITQITKKVVLDRLFSATTHDATVQPSLFLLQYINGQLLFMQGV